jgi:hypothetical protein
MPGLIKNPTQCQKVLAELTKAKGSWVNGGYMLRVLMLSQFHARVHELQKQGHRIEASTFKDEYGFKSYRLLPSDRLF